MRAVARMVIVLDIWIMARMVMIIVYGTGYTDNDYTENGNSTGYTDNDYTENGIIVLVIWIMARMVMIIVWMVIVLVIWIMIIQRMVIVLVIWIMARLVMIIVWMVMVLVIRIMIIQRTVIVLVMDNGSNSNIGNSNNDSIGDGDANDNGSNSNNGSNGDGDTSHEENSDNDMREIDRKEKRKIELFVENGCGCTLNVGMMCSLMFSIDHISSVRDQCSSFQRGELNNILFGHIMATVRTSDMTSTVRNPSTNRIQQILLDTKGD